MPRDARLDAFAGTDAGESVTGDDVEADAGSDDVEADELDPVASTFAWMPDGTCDDCGERAERRWRDDAGLVCADCKVWERQA